MRARRPYGITRTTPEQVELMRAAGLVVTRTRPHPEGPVVLTALDGAD